MAGDTIVRIGEIAEKFYFVKKGKIEVISSDNNTRIAILEEGAYFGEIGLLFGGKRTVTVKALSNCILSCLNKDKFDIIMDNFPDQKNFLKKV